MGSKPHERDHGGDAAVGEAAPADDRAALEAIVLLASDSDFEAEMAALKKEIESMHDEEEMRDWAEGAEEARAAAPGWARVLGLGEAALDPAAAAKTAAVLAGGAAALSGVAWANLHLPHAWSWLSLSGVVVACVWLCLRSTARPLGVEGARLFVLGIVLALVFAAVSWQAFDFVWSVETSRSGARAYETIATPDGRMVLLRTIPPAAPGAAFANLLGGLLIGGLCSALVSLVCLLAGSLFGQGVARLYRAMKRR